MGFIDEVKAFDNWLTDNDLSSQAIALWYALLNRFNRSGWKKDIPVSIPTLQTKTKLSPSAIKRARNALKQVGLIDFTARKGNQSTVYHFVSMSKFAVLYEPQSGLQSALQDEPQSEPRTVPQTVPQTVSQSGRNIRHKTKDKDVDLKESKTKKVSSKFVKPSVDEVIAYCKERNNQVDASRFVDYYDANGWRIGKNPMKDWKAAVRTWERNNYGGTNINAKNATTNKPESKFRFGEG